MTAEPLAELTRVRDHSHDPDYLAKLEKILTAARTHKDAGTDIPPAEIFAAVYLSDRPLSAADIRRGQEIWAEIEKENNR